MVLIVAGLVEFVFGQDLASHWLLQKHLFQPGAPQQAWYAIQSIIDCSKGSRLGLSGRRYSEYSVKSAIKAGIPSMNVFNVIFGGCGARLLAGGCCREECRCVRRYAM